ncbi:MAG TPA: hypothetical protein ENK27_04990 [Desulfobulbus sp.]|nr:hypothetical protein [Desulfobulbus sp.]
MDTSSYSDNIPQAMHDFVELVREETPVELHSIHVVGSVLTPDFQPGRSDINSVIVLERIDLTFLDFLVRLGATFREKKIAAPLLMTPHYIDRSLDVFPVEFFNFREIHLTMTGEDLLARLVIDDLKLRLQCEREVKSMLVGLRQGYLRALGDPGGMASLLAGSVKSLLPLLRALCHLRHRPPSLAGSELIRSLQQPELPETDSFEAVFALSRQQGEKLPEKEALTSLFARYYQAMEALAEYIDALAS